MGSGSSAASPTGRPAAHWTVTYATGASTVTRHLTCPAGTGDYSDPKAACAALTLLRNDLRQPATSVCRCPLELRKPGTATLQADSRTVVVPLTYCPYCGRPFVGDPEHAFRVLQPGAV